VEARAVADLVMGELAEEAMVAAAKGVEIMVAESVEAVMVAELWEEAWMEALMEEAELAEVEMGVG